MKYTEILAEHCSDLSFDKLSPEVVEKTKQCILDFFANVYGSQRLEAVRRVNEYIRSLGGPESATALGLGFHTGIHHAAFLNGMAAEAIEGQDGLRFGGNHPGVAVIPAALAIAEQRGLSGKEVICAIVAGYEAAGRISASLHPHHTLSGFLPTGTCGTFGATVAASKLMGHNKTEMTNALGNAGYVVPLSMAETLMGGYTSKIVQGGQAASAGLTAAGLADAGITGAPYILEGSQLDGGFAKITTGGRPMLERITDGLGESHSILDIYFKPYTACRHTHGCAQAALELAIENRFSRDDIEAVEVFTYAIAVIAVGKPVDETSTFVAAQFSIPYVVAACLLDHEMGPAQMREERIVDPTLLELVGKVTIQLDNDLNDMYPDHTASRVEIKLKNGEVLKKQIDTPKGDPRDPMTTGDLGRKLTAFAREEDVGKLGKLTALVLDLENMTDIRQLTSAS